MKLFNKINFKGKAASSEVAGENQFRFSTYAWKQFKQNKPAFYSYRLLQFMIILAVLAPLLANDKPLYCVYKGQSLFPAFGFGNEITISENGIDETLIKDQTDWKKMEFETVIWAPCAYAPGKSDIDNSDRVGPGEQQVFTKNNGEQIVIPSKFHHWLGTTKNGSDVLSGLLHGIKVSLFIGILSMLLASVIGIVLGALAGYFGNRNLSVSRAHFWMNILGVFAAFYYGFYIRSFELKDGFASGGWNLFGQIFLSLTIFIVLIVAFNVLGKRIRFSSFLKQDVNVPIDSMVSRGIEILNSLPVFILILTLSAIAKPSFITLILIMGFTTWAGIARLTRAEFLRISQLDYIQAGKALGLSETRIIFKHALPNGIAPALIQIAFGIAGAILVESSLSFLGVGVPPEMVTWGSILSEAKEDFSAWWLVIFPGFMIFITVTMYNLIGEGLRDALDPRLKK